MSSAAGPACSFGGTDAGSSFTSKRHRSRSPEEAPGLKRDGPRARPSFQARVEDSKLSLNATAMGVRGVTARFLHRCSEGTPRRCDLPGRGTHDERRRAETWWSSTIAHYAPLVVDEL